MKLITFIIPTYNSESYLQQAIDSLLVVKKDLEIIIVNDGSKDKTSSIAHDYQLKHKDIVKVIDKLNGGHGSAINAGLKLASSEYVKVLDSDDWIDESSLKLLIRYMKEHDKNQLKPDLYITNFVYEHVEDQTQYERDYSSNFPAYKFFNWNQINKRFKNSKTLLMHALIFKTKILKEIGLTLPEHTFYVDNIVAYVPLPYVKDIFYLDIPFYRYFIGRSDQSITLKNITSRYQQQIRVLHIMLNTYSYEFISQTPKKLAKYMKHYIASMLMITQMFTLGEDTSIRRNEIRNIWKDLKKQDLKMYRFLKYRTYNTYIYFLPWKLKRFVMINGYKYLVKKVKLG